MFEAVEVDEQYRNAPAVARRAREGLVEFRLKRIAVAQAGEGVMGGGVGQTRFRFAPQPE